MNPCLFRFAATVLAVCGLIVSAAFAGDVPLTLGEAQRLATARSTQLEASGLMVSASEEMAVAAGELPDPELKFGVDNLPVDGPDQFSLERDFMTMTQVGVMQEFTRPRKRRLRAERAQRAVQLAEAERVMSLASVQRATTLAWLDRYYAEAMERSVREQVNAAGLEVTAAEAAYRAGQGGSADVLAARGALAELEDQVADASRRVRGSTIALARWVGEDAERPLRGKAPIDVIPFHPHEIASRLAEHPEILALQRQAELAQTEVELARASKRPDWSVELMYSQRGDEFSNMVSLEFTVPLQINPGDRQNRELAAKLAEASQARAHREDMLRKHVADLRAMVDEWQSVRDRRDRYSATIIPLATDRTAATFAAYRGGKASLTEVLAARRNETDVQLRALQIESEAARLWAEITYITPASADSASAAAPSSDTTTSEDHQ